MKRFSEAFNLMKIHKRPGFDEINVKVMNHIIKLFTMTFGDSTKLDVFLKK